MAISLSSIQTGKDTKPPSILKYAVSGFGKTSFAAQSPNPIFLPTEDGIGDLEYSRFPLMKSYDDVKGAIKELIEQEHDYKTVVIDTVDNLEHLINKKVVDVYNAQGKKQITTASEIPFGGGSVAAMEYWKEICAGLEFLRTNKSMMPILLAQCAVKKFESPDLEPYDRYQLAIADKASLYIRSWAQIVLFGNYKTRLRESDSGKNKALGDGERVLYTQERPTHLAKNRFNLPYEIPFIKGQQWKDFQALLFKKSESTI